MWNRWLLTLLFILPVVSAQESHPFRNFIVLLIEVALIVIVILIVNQHILEKRKSPNIAKQINRVFLALLLFFAIFIRTTNECTKHQEILSLLSIMGICIALFYYLPAQERLNKTLIVFLAVALVFTVLHAKSHGQSQTREGVCQPTEPEVFLESPSLDIVLLLIILGLLSITLIDGGFFRHLRWPKSQRKK